MNLSEFVNQGFWFSGQRDRNFLHLCKLLSEQSFDPSTKCGCIVVDDENMEIAGAGVNAIPSQLTWNYRDRNAKYKRVVHAEMNALLTGSFSKNAKYTLYNYPAIPCAECVKHIIACGISRVVYPKASEDYLSRWAEASKISLELLNEAKVSHCEYQEII